MERMILTRNTSSLVDHVRWMEASGEQTVLISMLMDLILILRRHQPMEVQDTSRPSTDSVSSLQPKG